MARAAAIPYRIRRRYSAVAGELLVRESELCRAERSSLRWLIGGFVFCPCHLPITLGVLSAALAGSAAGVPVRRHPLVMGAAISLVWVLAMWRGLWLLRSRRGARIPCVRF